MGEIDPMNRYRVTVLREGTTEDETLFEIAGGAVLVGRLVPAALLDVLSADPEAQGEPERSLTDRVFDSAVSAGAEAEQDAADDSAGRPRRTRRTKAQIAADKEAVGLGFRDAAHRAEVEGANGAQVPTTFAGAAPVPAEVPSGFVPPAGEVVVGSVPGAVVTEAPAPPAAPYNPFA
jgi:hypothetical protein